MPHNTIKMNATEPFSDNHSAMATRIRLRGNWTTGHHQELMINLNNGKLLRISRSNGEDTFQVGANEDGNYVMPTLVETVIPDNQITVRTALDAFGQVHRINPSYEQSDCHEFAHAIYRILVPNVQGLPEEEDFM